MSKFMKNKGNMMNTVAVKTANTIRGFLVPIIAKQFAFEEMKRVEGIKTSCIRGLRYPTEEELAHLTKEDVQEIIAEIAWEEMHQKTLMDLEETGRCPTAEDKQFLHEYEFKLYEGDFIEREMFCK